MKIRHITALVLAGGKGKRMGKDKTVLDLGGRTLLQIAVDTAMQTFDRVIVAGGEKRLPPPVITVSDEIPGLGPMAGVLAGLKAADTEWVMTLPCDSPFVTPGFLRGMADKANDCDVVVPRLGAYYEPLHALYRKTCAAPLEALIRAGERKIIKLYEQVTVKMVGKSEMSDWDPSGLAFMNVNTREDLEKARALWNQVERKLK